jgi:hypothetical protein
MGFTGMEGMHPFEVEVKRDASAAPASASRSTAGDGATRARSRIELGVLQSATGSKKRQSMKGEWGQEISGPFAFTWPRFKTREFVSLYKTVCRESVER